MPRQHVLLVEAPDEREPAGPSLFLGGGISGCPDWQAEVVRIIAELAERPLTIFNPRRANFPIHNPSAAEAQIRWEHRYLRKASAILFWFPKETLCPITLYELGAWSMTDKPLAVGVHPEYARRIDVEIQTKLARPDVSVAYDLRSLASCGLRAVGC